MVWGRWSARPSSGGVALTELKLDLLQTLSLGAVVYFIGIQLRKRIQWLDRLNIPAAVIGGLLFTTLVLLLRQQSITIQLDTSMQATLSVAFFTSIGMGASLALLRAGGLQVLVFLLFASAFCLVQNFSGMGIAHLFGENPLLGVMAGSVTLVGGPATGLAFAPIFEQAGLRGRESWRSRRPPPASCAAAWWEDRSAPVSFAVTGWLPRAVPGPSSRPN